MWQRSFSNADSSGGGGNFKGGNGQSQKCLNNWRPGTGDIEMSICLYVCPYRWEYTLGVQYILKNTIFIEVDAL